MHLRATGTCHSSPRTRGVRRRDTNAAFSARRDGRPQVWLYRRGDKKVWILGTVTTIPRGTVFDASDIATKVAAAGAIVGAPGQVIGENVGVLRALSLWGSIRKEKLNKGGARLPEVLPPDTYSRWQLMKSRILGADNDMDRLRPMYAAYELFQAFSRQMGIGDTSPASVSLRQTAKDLGRDIIDARLHLPVSDARATVKAFEVSEHDDIACLERTMTAIDGLLARMPQLQDAWATGDLAALEDSVSRGAIDYCWATLTNQAIAKSEGVTDLSAAMNATWFRTVHSALVEGETVFTLAPVRDLISRQGPVALLLQDGFVQEEPFTALQTDLR